MSFTKRILIYVFVISTLSIINTNTDSKPNWPWILLFLPGNNLEKYIEFCMTREVGTLLLWIMNTHMWPHTISCKDSSLTNVQGGGSSRFFGPWYLHIFYLFLNPIHLHLKSIKVGLPPTFRFKNWKSGWSGHFFKSGTILNPTLKKKGPLYLNKNR